MRILILTNRVPYPLRDGGALAMDAMISGYKQAGQEVHLLAMNTSRHYISEEVISSLYADLDGFYTVNVESDVRAVKVLANFLLSREPEHAGRFRNARFAKRLTALLQQLSPDVVQLESPFLASYLPIMRRHPRTVVVYRMHNIEGQIWARLSLESGGLKGFYLRNLARRISRYEARLWRHADLLLPITRNDAEVVIAAGIKTPIEIAPFGIEARKENIPLPGGTFKVYHLAAMDWLPNVEAVRWFLEEAWPKLHSMSPEVEFYFAGRAMPDSFRHNLPDGAFCAGEIADAKAFAADKHALIVPLRAGSGVRIKILEAMFAGKLVISTDIGIQGIEAQSQRDYLRANSAQEFAHLIAWASAHPEKVASITSSAQEIIRTHYDASSIMYRIIQRLEAVVRQGSLQ